MVPRELLESVANCMLTTFPVDIARLVISTGLVLVHPLVWPPIESALHRGAVFIEPGPLQTPFRRGQVWRSRLWSCLPRPVVICLPEHLSCGLFALRPSAHQPGLS